MYSGDGGVNVTFDIDPVPMLVVVEDDDDELVVGEEIVILQEPVLGAT